MPDEPTEHQKSRWSDEELLRAAQQGDQEAYALFCVRSLPTLTRYLQHKCLELAIPSTQVADFAQETIFRALKQLSLTASDAGRPLPVVSHAWLSQIGYNLALDWLRRNRRSARALQVIAERTRPQTPRSTAVEEEALKYLNWLSADEREVIELFVLKEMTGDEVASELRISRDAAYKRYERAVQRVRDLVGMHGSNQEKWRTR